MQLRFQRRRLLHEEILKALEKGGESQAMVERLLEEMAEGKPSQFSPLNLKAGLILTILGIVIGGGGPVLFHPPFGDNVTVRVLLFIGVLLLSLGIILIGIWYFLDRPGQMSNAREE